MVVLRIVIPYSVSSTLISHPNMREKEMYEVKGSKVTFNVMTLDEAIHTAKTMNEFVSIKNKDFELVGIFGADSVEDGKCPDGHEYTWKKRRK
jgi:hypothetical protein